MRHTRETRARQAPMLAAVLVLVALVLVATAAALPACRYVREAPIAPPAHPHPLKTGDLILASSRKGRERLVPPPCVSTLIKMATRSHFNHVALVFVHPRTGERLVWEMNGAGPALTPLDAYVRGRDREHDVFVRRLSRQVDPVAFAEIMAAQGRDRYNFVAPLDIMRARWRRGARRCGRSGRGACARTCPHTVAEVYRALGVLDYSGGRGIDPAALVPADFARDPIDARVLPLAAGFALGPITALH